MAYVAQKRLREQQARQRRKQARLARYGPQVITMENVLNRVKRHLRAALRAAEGVTFDNDQRDLLAHTIDTVRRALATYREVLGVEEKLTTATSDSPQNEGWSTWVPMHRAHDETSVPDVLLLALRRTREPDYEEQLNVVVNDLLDRGQIRLRTLCPSGDPTCRCRYSNTIHVCWPLGETQSDQGPR